MLLDLIYMKLDVRVIQVLLGSELKGQRLKDE